MVTKAEILKSEMDNASVFTWDNYGTTPTIKINKLEDISGTPPDESIILENKNSGPTWAFNNVKLVGNNSVQVEITMPTSEKRDNIMEDIDAGVLASAYDITYSISGEPDEYPIFKTILNMKILL